MRLALRLAIPTLIAGLTFVACSSTAGSGASVAPAATAAGAATATITIKGFAFSPATLTVDKGTVVTVTNADGTTHTVTSGTNGTKDGKFDQRFEGGTSGTITFATVGTFTYFCNIHGVSMTGTIVVK
jgi:plastocyanin